MGKYILNKETQKIELHFSKPEYLALTDSQKSEIKSAFLWSGKAGAWVSRSTNYHYHPTQIAIKLGLEDGGTVGERLSYAEELEAKAERAEARADRMEEHAANAEKRAENLQKEFNSYHGDIAFFTQPNINSSRGRAFTNYRNRVYARYESGMKEYRKSEYFQGRAETARTTADMSQLKDPIYLHNRIKECNSNIKKLQETITAAENNIYKMEQGETLKLWNGSCATIEGQEERITNTLEKMEYELDKLAFMENNIEEIGGNRFNKGNIKPGYIVKIRRWGNVLVTATGPVNFGYKMIRETGNLKDWPGQDPYEAIIEIVEANEIKKQDIKNPYNAGDILCKHRSGDDSIYQAYQVIKTTDTGVKIQRIKVENGKPVPDSFTDEKPMQKKVITSRWSDFVGIYIDNWQLHKYSPEAKAV